MQCGIHAGQIPIVWQWQDVMTSKVNWKLLLPCVIFSESQQTLQLLFYHLDSQQILKLLFCHFIIIQKLQAIVCTVIIRNEQHIFQLSINCRKRSQSIYLQMLILWSNFTGLWSWILVMFSLQRLLSFLLQQDTLLTFVSGTTFLLVNLVPKC
jgi:hypothetical protein